MDNDPRVLRILNDAAAGVDALAQNDVEYLVEARLCFEEVLTARPHSPFSFVMFPWERLDRLTAALKAEGY